MKTSLPRHNVTAGTLLLSFIVLLGAYGMLVPGADPVAVDLANRFASPSAMHWFGTDEYGRDIFARVAAGATTSLRVSVTATALAALTGLALGSLAGYVGRWLDQGLMLILDAVMAFPGLLLVLGMMSVLGPSETGVVCTLAIAFTPAVTRVIRSVVQGLREREFVIASRLLGNPGWRTVLRHVVPNCATPLSVIATSVFSGCVLAESALSFLGLGIPPPAPSWGGMLADGRQYVGLAAWSSIFPGLAIAATLLGANLLGDGLRDIWDPRMKIVFR